MYREASIVCYHSKSIHQECVFFDTKNGYLLASSIYFTADGLLWNSVLFKTHIYVFIILYNSFSLSLFQSEQYLTQDLLTELRTSVAWSISVICFSRSPPTLLYTPSLNVGPWRNKRTFPMKKKSGTNGAGYKKLYYWTLELLSYSTNRNWFGPSKRNNAGAFNTLVWFEWPFPLAGSPNDVFIRIQRDRLSFETGAERAKLGNKYTDRTGVGTQRRMAVVRTIFILFSLKKINTIFSIPIAVTYNGLIRFYRTHYHYFHSVRFRLSDTNIQIKTLYECAYVWDWVLFFRPCLRRTCRCVSSKNKTIKIHVFVLSKYLLLN